MPDAPSRAPVPELLGQLIRYAGVGLLNTAVGLGLIWALMAAGLHPALANGLGYAVGMALSFVLNRVWTFRTAGGAAGGGAPVGASALRFVAAGVAAWALNLGALTAGMRFTDISPYLLQIGAAAVYTGAFFVLCRGFVFRAPGGAAPGARLVARIDGWTGPWGLSAMRLALILGCAAALAHALWRAGFGGPPAWDWNYLWLAGDLWRAGQNPYGPEFAEAGAQIVAFPHTPKWFVYPPNWHPLSWLASAGDRVDSIPLWRTACVAMLVLGWEICRRTTAALPGGAAPARSLGAALFLGFGSATGLTLFAGQTSPLVFLGAALIFRGWTLRDSAALAVGLVLVMLKPNVGLAFVALAMTRRWAWPALIAAGAATLLAALPAFVTNGVGPALTGFLHQLSRYGSHFVNTPPNMTGLYHLIWAVLDVDAPKPPLSLAGAACVAAAGIWGARRGADAPGTRAPETRAAEASLALAAAFFFTPAHNYDLLALAPLIFFAGRGAAAGGAPSARVSALLSAAAFLALWRVQDISPALHMPPHPEELWRRIMPATIAVTALLLAAALDWARLTRRGPVAAPEQAPERTTSQSGDGAARAG